MPPPFIQFARVDVQHAAGQGLQTKGPSLENAFLAIDWMENIGINWMEGHVCSMAEGDLRGMKDGAGEEKDGRTLC